MQHKKVLHFFYFFLQKYLVVQNIYSIFALAKAKEWLRSSTE